MKHQPTNAEIIGAFNEHTKDDRQFQDEQRLVNEDQAVFRAETEGSLSDIHTKLEVVATKQDIKELLEYLAKIKIGVGVFGFTFKNARSIGSFITLLFGLYLLFKFGFMGAVHWLLSKTSL